MSNERRAALAAAFDAAEKDEEGQETELEEEVPEDVEPEQPDSEVGEEDAEEGEGEGESPKPDPQRVEQEAASRQASGKQGKSKEAKQGTQQAPGQPSAEVKAPQSWTPAEREHWGKMPKEAQAAVQRRELEVQQALSRSADSRKFQDSFVRTIQPYAHLIRAQNSSPLQAVNNLMQTAAGLTQGTQPQKAAIVAEIISNYGIDIQVLDDVLSKRPVQQGQQGTNSLPAPVLEALKPVYNYMNQQEQIRAQQLQQITAQAETVVSQMAEKLPFFEDLREEMADAMELAASNGRAMTMEQAHSLVVGMHPEIKKILDQRARAARLKQDPNKILRARKAGASIKGAPNGAGGGSGKPTSRRAALSDAWDDAAG